MKQLLTCLFVLTAMLPLTAEAQAEDPAVIPYSGVLQEDGALVNGLYDFQFAVFDEVSGGVELWSEEVPAVQVSAGRFGVEMGMSLPFPWRVFNGPAYLSVGVRGPTDAVYRVLQGRQRLRPAARAVKAHNGVPIGTLIDWWRSDPADPLPMGYEFCDGGAVYTPGSPIFGRSKPDLRGRVTVGVNIDVSANNAAGTTHTQVRNNDRPPLDFAAVEPTTRIVSTDVDGNHTHQWGGYNSSRFYTWDGAGNYFGFTQWGDGMDADGGGEYVLGHSSNPSGHRYFTNPDPAQSIHSHSITITPSDLLVPHVGVLKLIRVR